MDRVLYVEISPSKSVAEAERVRNMPIFSIAQSYASLTSRPRRLARPGVRKFHIVLSRHFNLEAMERAAADERSPRHSLWTLARELDATVHDPSLYRPTAADRLRARLYGTPAHWALARALESQLGPDDVVYGCGAEAVTIPLTFLRRGREAPAFGMYLMSPSNRRLRSLLANPLFAHAFELLVVSNEHKRVLARKFTRVPDDRVFVLPEQTDTRFFTPGPCARTDRRPLVFSAGLEHRDYRVLAEAVDGLPVDCLVCALSPNASRSSARFPQRIPPNMSIRPLDWPEFRQAYRDANIVVVPVVKNLFSAGATVVMEAFACGRPVIMTDTPGIPRDLAERKLLLTVPPGDARALRASLITLIQQPELAGEYAARGRDSVLRDHTLEIVMAQLGARLRELRAPQLPAALHPARRDAGNRVYVRAPQHYSGEGS